MSVPAFLYARFSSLEQGRGTSLKRQFENARQYADRRGWLLDPEREISDQGRSAFHGANRSEGGALWRFERQVEKGLYRNGAVFVVEHFDRISRQGWEEVHAFLKLCVEHGVSVATIDGDRFYPAGQRIDGATIMELVFKSEGAREESKKKSDRGLFNWSAKVKAIEAGDRKTNIGLPPGWMRRLPTGEVVLDEHRAKVLNEIFECYVDGMGLPGIVRRLNGRGEPTWGTGKKAESANGWNTAYLNKLLNNRAVLGEYEPMSRTHGGINETSKGLRVANHYPQAVTAELWARAQAVKSSRRGFGGPGEAQVNNLFSGSVFCARCGSPMYLQSQQRAGRPTNHRSRVDGRKLSYLAGTDRSYLMCNNNRRQHECGNRARFRYEHLEPAILDAVLGVVIDDSRFSVPDSVAALAASVAELERLIEGKRFNLGQLRASLKERFSATVMDLVVELEGEIGADEQRLAEIADELRRESGGGSPQEQLERVREVRASLTAEDPDVRYAARSRVKQALSHLIRIDCDAEGVATVDVAAGLMAWRFNTQGEPLGSVDLRGRLDLHRGLIGGELGENAGRVDAVLRRSA